MSGPKNETLASNQLRYLRAKAHHLRPVVQVGKDGLAEGVLEALSQALEDHELVKVRMHEPEDRHAMANDLAAQMSAYWVGLIGFTAILYRPSAEKPRIVLPLANRAA